jgi:ABC-2 type transport system permease protein
MEAMNASGLFNIEVYDSPDRLYDDVKRGEVDVGLWAPSNFSESLSSGEKPVLWVFYVKSEWGDFSYQVVQGFLSAFEDRLRANMIEYASGYAPPQASRRLELIADPLNVEVSSETPPLLSTPGGLRAYYALSMVGIEALFIGLFPGAMAINERKRTGTLQVILSSPMRDWELLASDTLAALTMVGLSAAAVVSVSLATGAKYAVDASSIAVSALILVAGTIFTIGLGLLIAPLAKTPEGASALVNAIAFPVMFAGGIAIPVFILPEPLQVFANYWPLSRAVIAVRRLLLNEFTISEALAYSAPAAVASLLVYTLGLFVYKRLLARAVEYY